MPAPAGAAGKSNIPARAAGAAKAGLRPAMSSRTMLTSSRRRDARTIRLQKLLAQSGVASRRKCEELMLEGHVEVDGEVVTRLGTKVDPVTAVIRVNGQRLPPASAHVYLVLNKPAAGSWTITPDAGSPATTPTTGAGRPGRLQRLTHACGQVPVSLRHHHPASVNADRGADGWRGEDA